MLEPKEGEEVVLYEVLDKDIKSSSSKQKSQRKDSQSEQQSEVCTVSYQLAFYFPRVIWDITTKTVFYG